MKIKNDFKLREICGEYVVTAEGMQAVDFTKLISLNETAAFLWKTAEKQGEFTIASLAQTATTGVNTRRLHARTESMERIRKKAPKSCTRVTTIVGRISVTTEEADERSRSKRWLMSPESISEAGFPGPASA